ncbi:unnamed protein product [Rhizoctonia solani]|uniref:Ricin B lectin domain-containing protein n=1 Tax=Rhizoctonia solani TaxID=456999 RepID=A0A8H3A4C0_9AGAM|nr:unnamed protein product [Rhizoctonia solani]
MGQDIYISPHAPDEYLKPGTYRVFNPTAGTAIQLSYHDPTGVVTWEKHEGEIQQRVKWFLQRSGHGYRLQNRRYGGYLAVCNTDNGGLVYASRYPTTWLFLKYNNDYIVQTADKNRVLDLDGCSSRNGNIIHIFNLDGNNMAHRIWGLERLSDDFGDNELAEIQEGVSTKNRELSRLREELANAKQEIIELRSLLNQHYEATRQQNSSGDVGNHACEINEELIDLYNQQDILGTRLSQCRAETASPQARDH